MKESVAALGLKHGKRDNYVVRFYTINQPGNAPAGFKAIARERRTGNHVEATYKVRGPTPFPTNGSYLWECPLQGHAESKNEIDITWTGDELPKRAYSQSCTAKVDMSHAMPAAYGAKPLGCTSRMHRLSDHGIKLELWKLPGGKQVFEVSISGEDSAVDLKTFQTRIVSRLLSRGVKPLKESKTELGSAC